MVLNVERLIEAVKNEPAIWDKSSGNYRKTNVREKCWISVAKRAIDNWEKLDQKEKQKQIVLLKSKWKHVKSYMFKIQVFRKSDPMLRKGKYSYEDKLQFLLLPTERLNTTESTSPGRPVIDEDTLADTTSIEPGPSVSVTPPQICLPKDSLPFTTTPMMSPFRNRKSPPDEKPAMEVIEYFEENSRIVERFNKKGADPDACYLMSILDDYRSLPKNQKWAFQRTVAEFFIQSAKSMTSHGQEDDPRCPHTSHLTQPPLFVQDQDPLFPHSQPSPFNPLSLGEEESHPSPMHQLKSETISEEDE